MDLHPFADSSTSNHNYTLFSGFSFLLSVHVQVHRNTNDSLIGAADSAAGFFESKVFRPANPGPCHPRRRNHLNGLSGAENGCIAAVLLRRVLISQSINGTSVSLKTKWKEDPTLLQLCFIQPSRSARLCAFIAFKLNSDSHNRARRSIKDNFKRFHFQNLFHHDL